MTVDDLTEADLTEALEAMTANELRTLMAQVYAQAGGVN